MQFFNKQCMTLRLLLHSCYIYISMCSLMTPCNRTLWYGQYTRGLRTPQYGVKNPNTFTSAAPRTYSIICISSESCLWSNVGFARLPCFATLRSALSARVVKGELLRLCFRFIWSSTSVEKAKNRLSWCCESWSTTRWLIGIFRDSLRIIRRTFLFRSYM